MRLTEEEIIRRYKAGESVTILAKAVGSSRMLYAVLERHDIPQRTKKGEGSSTRAPAATPTTPLGQLLEERRMKLGLTPQQIGKECGVGAAHIRRIERGVKFPSSELLIRVGKILGFTEVELARCPKGPPVTATEPTRLITPERTPADIADALLSRVINYLHDYDSLLEDRANLKEATKEVSRLGSELKKVEEEKTRLLKLHNDQVKRQALTSVEELELLAMDKERSQARLR